MTTPSAKSSNSQGTDTPRKRRILNIGPGLIIAIILSIVVGYRYVGVQRQIAMQRPQPPIVERQLVYSDSAQRIGPTPEIGFIIARRDRLGISAEQVRKLTKIQLDWRKYYGPKIAQANAAAQKTGRYLADAKGNKRTPVAQIENEASAVVALSGEIASARRSYWDQAEKILTPAQRATLENQREADWKAKTKAPAAKTQ